MGSGIVCGNLYYVRHSCLVLLFVAFGFSLRCLYFGENNRGVYIPASIVYSTTLLSFRVYLDTGVITSTLPHDGLEKLLEKCDTSSSMYIDSKRKSDFIYSPCTLVSSDERSLNFPARKLSVLRGICPVLFGFQDDR